jgi:hypothetical protein
MGGEAHVADKAAIPDAIKVGQAGQAPSQVDIIEFKNVSRSRNK